MKRVLLSTFVVCLLAGQAFAGMFELDADTALQFTEWSVSDTSQSVYYGPTTDLGEYGADSMQLAVGYSGSLQFNTTVMTISAGNSAGLSGSFNGFQGLFANDNEDDWSVQLFVTTDSGTSYSGWTSLDPGTQKLLTLAAAFDFDDVVDFGFQVTGSSDNFHISAVPTPVAVLLGVLGLGVAGLKLRKYV